MIRETKATSVNITALLFTIRWHAAQILSISIYLESGHIQKVAFGKRATVYKGIADTLDILHNEVTETDSKRTEKDLEKLQEDLTQGEKIKTLIMGELSNSVAYFMRLIIFQYPGPNSSKMMLEDLHESIWRMGWNIWN